ncbi:hypothetical protein C7E12_21850, partial [Stenotrophomonas maltophilia]
MDLVPLQTAIGAEDAQGLPMMGLTYPAGDANGTDEQASLLAGFQAWARVDLVPLQTAIGAEDAQGLPMMGLTYPAGD